MPKGIRKNGTKLGFQKGVIPWHKGKFLVSRTIKLCPCGKQFFLTPGRTLCIDCHKKTDSYGWKAWNNYIKKPHLWGEIGIIANLIGGDVLA